MTQPVRCAKPMPAGLVKWMSSEASSVEAVLYRYFVRRGMSCPLEVRTIAADLSLEVKAVATALFNLGRDDSIVVDNPAATGEPPRSERVTLQMLDESVQRLARQCGGKLVLADHTGLCIASAGVMRGEAEQQCAGIAQGDRLAWPVVVPLHLGHEQIKLRSPDAMNTDDPEWVRLAHCLMNLH